MWCGDMVWFNDGCFGEMVFVDGGIVEVVVVAVLMGGGAC